MTDIIILDRYNDVQVAPSTPSHGRVLDQLQRILDSRTFARSPRLQRFLRYAVEVTLRGDHDRLKEYTLGVEVFDRHDDFDPRLDSIVRVEAFRARKKLARYYAVEGRGDEVLIYLNKGDYRARFAYSARHSGPGRQLHAAFGWGVIRFWESTGPAGERNGCSGPPATGLGIADFLKVFTPKIENG